MSAREELRLLAESLPDPAVEELTAIGRLLAHRARFGAVQEVTDPDEVAVVIEALRADDADVEYTLEQAKAELAARRRAQGV